jgi:hypothetical protein
LVFKPAAFAFSFFPMRVPVLLTLSFLTGPVGGRAESNASALLPATLSVEGSGRATAYAEHNKIITHEGKTHVVWLDADGEGFWARGRTLDRTSGEWGPLITIGSAQDNHGGPALTLDSNGYLHVVYYPHHAPFHYRRSSRPNDLSAWEPVIEFGEELSYPMLVCAPDDTLVLTARRGYHAAEGANKQSMRMEQELWRKPADSEWQRVGQLILSRLPGYAHFAAGLAWGPEGRLHLNTRIYEGNARTGKKPMNTIGYMVSEDRGDTWKTAAGEPLTMPVDAESIDCLADDTSAAGLVLNSGPLGVDAAGVPHLIYTTSVAGNSHLYLATPAPGLGWTRRDLRPYLPAEATDWQIDLGMGGGLSFSTAGRATIVAVVLNPPASESDPLKAWGHRTTEIVRFWSDDNLKTFQSEILSEENPEQTHWLPNIERPTGHNLVPATPGVIYTAGPAGAGLHDLNLNNEVRWQHRRYPPVDAVPSP